MHSNNGFEIGDRVSTLTMISNEKAHGTIINCLGIGAYALYKVQLDIPYKTPFEGLEIVFRYADELRKES